MAGQQVVAAMSGVPELSSFVSAINKASYAATFDSSRDITVFAPVNSAFDKLPEGQLDKWLADREALVGLLGYHVVQGRKTPADLADATLTTKQTGSITTKVTDDTITLNGKAKVLCPNIQTANATIYLIDTVLQPPS
ncbi:fasciclin domain-containing protein [Nonomuraea sp. NPDC050536]|uniref:fasciclin domain-containing protein n=1 Tax=Nonomuraea sp. NPDC050536 TaxID=3364366 RepID=UPI0037C708EE